jgi:hypothetical protein
MSLQQQRIDVSGKVVARFKDTHSDPGYRNEAHHQPIRNEEAQKPGKLTAWTIPPHNQGREKIAYGNPLQDARYTKSGQVEDGIAVHKKSEHEKNECPLHNLQIQPGVGETTLLSPRKREYNRNAHDEQKEWKNGIGKRPPVPFSMSEL